MKKIFVIALGTFLLGRSVAFAVVPPSTVDQELAKSTDTARQVQILIEEIKRNRLEIAEMTHRVEELEKKIREKKEKQDGRPLH